MNELSLFTGAGGGLLGTRLLGWHPIGYVEWNAYCQRVLAARIADGFLPAAPIFTDVREFVQSGAAREYRGFADVVSAGFPCQPFSVAGKQAGADDERNMWPATRDVIREVRPRYVLLENVPGIASTGYAGVVTAELAAMGYMGSNGCVSAAETGADHERERLLFVAHAECERQQGSGTRRQPFRATPDAYREANQLVDAIRKGTVPFVCRSHDGMANRMERLTALGNGIVPAVVRRAWELLS